MGDKEFTLYWLDGKREVVVGRTAARAMTSAGYGAGALRALDFCANGDNDEWEWNQSARGWDRIKQAAADEVEGQVRSPEGA